MFALTLATASQDTTVRLWDVALPTPAAAVQKICRAVPDLTPSPASAFA